MSDFDSVYFTICDTYSDSDKSDEVVINLKSNHDGSKHFSIDYQDVGISNQQLMELGALFIAMAGKTDFDSAGEMLDGYGFDRKEYKKLFDKLAKAL